MPAVTLTQFWVHDGDDLSDYLTFYTRDRGDDRQLPGEVRRYVGGRLRAVVRAGLAKTLTITLVNVTAAQLTQLEDWVGHVVQVRDHLGRRMYASYFSMAVSDNSDRSGHDVAVVFQQVSRLDEV